MPKTFTLRIKGKGRIRACPIGSREWCIEQLFIKDGHRQSGYGSRLMRQMLARIRDQSGKKVYLVPSPVWGMGLERLRRFYRKFGFGSLGRPVNKEDLMVLKISKAVEK